MASENGKWTILIMGLLFKMSWTKAIQLGTTVRPGFERDEGFYADLCYLQDQTYSDGTPDVQSPMDKSIQVPHDNRVGETN